MAPRRTYTSADGLIARAGRAAEDPKEMTRDATLGRMARRMVEIVRANPELTDEQIVKATRLKVKAEMAALARKSAAARRGQPAA